MLKNNPRSEGQFIQDLSESNSYATIPERTTTFVLEIGKNERRQLSWAKIQDQQQEESPQQKYENQSEVPQDQNQLIYFHKLRKIVSKEEAQLILKYEAFSKDEVKNFDLPEQKNTQLLALMKKRLESGFFFDAQKNQEIFYSSQDPLYMLSDIFMFLTGFRNDELQFNYIKKGMKSEILSFNAIRKFYSHKERRDYLKQYGVEFFKDSHIQYFQATKLHQQLIGSGQYNRLAALITCLNSYKYEKLSEIEKNIEAEIVCIFKVATQLFLSDQNENKEKYTKLLKAMCKGVIHQDAYIQLFYNFFGMDDSQFQDYLIHEDTKLHFYDKLILCCIYCNDNKLNEFLEKTNSLDQIIVFGVSSPQTIVCLKQYLQKTQDIQLVGIISAHIFLLGDQQEQQQQQLAEWFREYQSLLNSQQWHEYRIKVEKEIKDYQNQQKKLRPNLLQYLDNLANRTPEITHQCQCKQMANPECLSCFTLYPKCSICQSPIQNQQYIVCLKCKHGGHEKHINEWFAIYSQCPFKHCRCQCSYN